MLRWRQGHQNPQIYTTRIMYSLRWFKNVTVYNYNDWEWDHVDILRKYHYLYLIISWRGLPTNPLEYLSKRVTRFLLSAVWFSGDFYFYLRLWRREITEAWSRLIETFSFASTSAASNYSFRVRWLWRFQAGALLLYDCLLCYSYLLSFIFTRSATRTVLSLWDRCNAGSHLFSNSRYAFRC